MNPEHKKKLDESNEKITIEDILKAIKQKNDNTNIQKHESKIEEYGDYLLIEYKLDK